MHQVAPADKRSQGRLRPKGLVSLAIYQGELIPPAYGILTDISEHGMRIISDRILVTGQELQLRIQFESESDLFETSGKVVWTQPASEIAGKLTGTQLGIQLSLPSKDAAHWLRRLLISPEFETEELADTQFDEFMASLQPYLDRVGAYFIDRESRRRGRPPTEH